MVAGTKFVVDTHYTPLKQVGTGAYGVVWYGFVNYICG